LEVQAGLESSQRGEVKAGDSAHIILPGNMTVKGKVERIGKVAARDATIPAYISLDAPKQAHGFDRAPVQVQIATKGVESALSVPVTALLGKSGGGFAVEVVRDGAQRELVAVELGLLDTASGRVEVEGDLEAGDPVVVPSL
jgi:multidrug efflux pump subunit AcrA (membrane-fusion protein)